MVTEIEGGFTAFSHRNTRPDGRRRYVEDTPERPEGTVRQFDPNELQRIAKEERRWAWVNVDLKAIRANCSRIRQKIGFGRHLMAVLNADAYGHGAVRVAETVLKAGADHLAVATVDEGIALREAMINAPVLVLSEPPETAIPLLLAYKLMPSIQTAEFAIQYGEMADQYGMKAPYHLEVNVGLNRTGVHYSEAVQLLSQVSFHRALDLKGVFAEFAVAASMDRAEMQREAQRFVEVVAAIRGAGFDPGLVHCANSTSALRYPELYFDMVRVGLPLFGLHPCRETVSLIDLQPAMSVHARITNVMSVPVGEGVGYGHAYRCGGSVKVCTLPVGYGDGYPRILSGRTYALYQGQRIRQVGEISMDHCMVEVDLRTHVGMPRMNPQVGDEVVLMGNQGGASLTLDEMANMCGTTNYELACGFGLRLPRVYE